MSTFCKSICGHVFTFSTLLFSLSHIILKEIACIPRKKDEKVFRNFASIYKVELISFKPVALIKRMDDEN
jgi:hypothetical protein